MRPVFSSFLFRCIVFLPNTCSISAVGLPACSVSAVRNEYAALRNIKRIWRAHKHISTFTICMYAITIARDVATTAAAAKAQVWCMYSTNGGYIDLWLVVVFCVQIPESQTTFQLMCALWLRIVIMIIVVRIVGAVTMCSCRGRSGSICKVAMS